MPVFFICFIVFIFWIRVKTKLENRNTSTWDTAYWEKEKKANFVRKKDISQLDYLRVKEEELPFNPDATGEELEKQEQIRALLDKKMINLSHMTNADIKLNYGTANFSTLSVYDQNYLTFMRNLGLWGTYLWEQAKKDTDTDTLGDAPEDLLSAPRKQELSSQGKDYTKRAKQILEYAINLGSDISSTYLTLAQIYLMEEQLDRIQELIQRVEGSDFYLKDSLVKQLKSVMQHYI